MRCGFLSKVALTRTGILGMMVTGGYVCTVYGLKTNY